MKEFPLAQKVLERKVVFDKAAKRIFPQTVIDKAQKIETLEEIKGFAELVIDEATKQKGELGLQRMHGVKRATTELEKLAVRFAGFIESYAGIVEIVKQAGGTYGNLAYSSLSLLLVVAVNKSKIEEKLDSTLDSLGTEFPRLVILVELVQEKDVTARLDRIFGNVIEFARKAVQYYKRNWLSRPCYVAVHSSRQFDSLQGQIAADAVHIWNAATTKTHRTIQDLKKQNNDLKADIQKLMTEAEDERALRDRVSVQQAKVLLEVKEIPLSVLETYEQDLRNPRFVPDKYEQFKFEKLEQRTEFQEWRDSPGSGVLILRGHTARMGKDNSDLCWLSVAAFDMVKQYLALPDTITASYYLEPTEYMVEDIPAYNVFANIIWQLLQQRPALVHEPARLQELEMITRSPQWKAKDPREPCKILRKILDDIPDSLIILDRIDRCNCRSIELVKRLLGLVTGGQNRVRIFAVFGEGAETKFERKDLELSGCEPLFLITLHQGIRKPKTGLAVGL